MNRTILLTAGLVLVLATIGSAQIAHDYPGGGDLGYHDWTQPLATPLALTDTTVVLPVQGIHAHPDRPNAGLRVLRHLHGIVLVDFVPIPGNLLDADGIWDRPYRLDDRSLVMPAVGPDGQYGTPDDQLVLVTGLNEPAAATVRFINLGTRGPYRWEDVHVDSSQRIFYLQGALDAYSASGEQNLVVVDQIGGPGENVQVIFVGASDGSGAAPNFVQLDTGWLMPLTGRDGSFTTADDEFGLLSFPNGQAVITVYALGFPIHVPTDQVWPRRIGPDSFCFATLGVEGSASDDEIIRVTDLTTSLTVRSTSVGGEPYFVGVTGNPNLCVDQDGTLIAPHTGQDGVFGTDDDQILVHEPNSTEALPAWAALRPNGGGFALDPMPISDSVTLVPHYGSSTFSYGDPGLVIVSRLPNGTHSAVTILLFGEVKRIVRMTDSSAMVFTATGASHYFSGLGTSQFSQYQVAQNGWDGLSEPVLISPAAVATTAASVPDPNYVVADTLRLHKVAASFSYGEESPNANSYTMDVGVGSNAPLLGGSAYQVTISNAPPSEPAVLLVSLARDHLEVMPGVFLLVEPESVFYMVNWGTFANGASAINLLPPTNPLFQGIAGHFQWLVWDAASPRGFQLSKGLTISF